MSFDFKAAAPDNSITDDNSGVFGGDSQSASTPSWYSFGTIKTYLQSFFMRTGQNLADVASVDAARQSLALGWGAPKSRFYAFTDCVINTSGGVFSDHWKADWANGGSFGSVAVASFNAIGIYNLLSGTATNGRAAFGSTQLDAVKLGLGVSRFATRFAIHTLSNGTDTYSSRIGFIDSHSGESTDGCFFRYTDAVNSGKWQAVCRSNGVESAVDTGVTPTADTFQRFEVVVNAAGTSADFNIDGTTKATITTNIPTGAGRETGYGVMGLKSAGTTNTSMGYLDYAEVEINFTAGR